jgi:hypothetical protein
MTLCEVANIMWMTRGSSAVSPVRAGWVQNWKGEAVGQRTRGGMWCDHCNARTRGVKNMHRIRNSASAITFPFTGGLSAMAGRVEGYVCQSCGSPVRKIRPSDTKGSGSISVLLGLPNVTHTRRVKASVIDSQLEVNQKATLQNVDEGSANSRLEELKLLGELRDSGVLTEEEFEAEKARILGQSSTASLACACGHSSERGRIPSTLCPVHGGS